jgi:hypothetical protein
MEKGKAVGPMSGGFAVFRARIALAARAAWSVEE